MIDSASDTKPFDDRDGSEDSAELTSPSYHEKGVLAVSARSCLGSIVTQRLRWLLGAYVAAVSVALLPAWLLLFAGETLSGHLAGLICVLLAALPAGWVVAHVTRRRKWLPFGIGGGLLVAAASMLVLTPNGQAPPESPVRSVFLQGEFDRWSIANIVPEADQLKLGTYFVAPVDPFIDWEQASRLRALVVDQYRDMNEDPAFRRLGSVMGYAYDDRDVGHLYVYAPGDTKGRPVLLFLHGSAGSFKAYFHLFYELAKTLDMVLVCPSFGFGNWHNPGGMEAIDRAYEYAIDSLGGDRERVYVMALSNGGRGATRTLAFHPERYAGVVFVSSVMESEILGSALYDAKPVLVLHGAKDRRIPVSHAEWAVRILRETKARVSSRVWPQEDHFLLFSKETEVRDEIRRWMDAPNIHPSSG